jgi:hypothetical protein
MAVPPDRGHDPHQGSIDQDRWEAPCPSRFEQYTPFFPFEGGTILKVEVSIADDAYIDLEQHLAAALARD